MGKHFADTPWFAGTKGAQELVRRAITGAAKGEAFRREIALVRPNGETMTFDFSLTPVRNEAGGVQFLVPEGRDITEVKRAESALLKSEKLAAVGRLASGIAHEIRNPVAMIASALATAADTATDAQERDEMFAIADRQAKRLERLTTDFLTYARPSAPRRTPILISDLLSSIAAVTRVRVTGREIRLACLVACDETVNLDASQVEGALLNLTLNAIDAVDGTGGIDIRARMEDSLLGIEVQNSGRAIPELHLARIFEHFFTTKPGGTGLGLAAARGVARAHGGDLWVSRNEEGSVTFTMTLAACAVEEDEQEAAGG
jgi:signal transduction histidine kinase